MDQPLDVILGRKPAVLIGSRAESSHQAIFPGAFNPLHDGHRQMAAIASEWLSTPLAYELSIENVDKPPLEVDEVTRRLKQFTGAAIWLTRAPTFAAKAALFPGATFVAGIDTIKRLADVRYAGDSIAQRDEAIATIAAQGCRFLVFGRSSGESFATIDDIDLPLALRKLCEQVPMQQFRADVSSTELRNEIR